MWSCGFTVVESRGEGGVSAFASEHIPEGTKGVAGPLGQPKGNTGTYLSKPSTWDPGSLESESKGTNSIVFSKLFDQKRVKIN